MAHDLIKFAAAPAFQCVLVQGEYTLPNSKMEIEPLGACPSNLNIKPFDLAFTPEPLPTSVSAPAIPYGRIGLDVTISPTHELTPLTLSTDNVIEEVAAVAEKHLQKSERKKVT